MGCFVKPLQSYLRKKHNICANLWFKKLQISGKIMNKFY